MSEGLGGSVFSTDNISTLNTDIRTKKHKYFII